MTLPRQETHHHAETQLIWPARESHTKICSFHASLHIAPVSPPWCRPEVTLFHFNDARFSQPTRHSFRRRIAAAPPTMEALLSLSFDNITSSSPTRIRKGLRQIEGLLAQICLPKTTSSSLSPTKRNSSAATPPPPASPEKGLANLIEDPAFREFFRLQESFEWNGTMPLPTLSFRAIPFPLPHTEPS